MGCCGPWGLPSPPKHATKNLKLTEYLKLSREERTKHVDLSEPCYFVEGVGAAARQGRGRKALLELLRLEDDLENWAFGRANICHVCTNGSNSAQTCSNPKHLYVVTSQENSLDRPVEERREGARKARRVASRRAHETKDERGKSVTAVKAGKVTAVKALAGERDERGKLVSFVKLGKASAERARSTGGKRVCAVAGARAARAQVWVSLVDGFVGTSNTVALHNQAVGKRSDKRVRLSAEEVEAWAPLFEDFDYTTLVRGSGRRRRKTARRVPEQTLELLRLREGRRS